ncbi:hypothetical protein BDN72DRAFT_739591, partial [Pluteus cervinus]
PSFGKYLLEQQASLGPSFDETAYLPVSMFGHGSDTTASGISVGDLTAACYPEVQQRVQEELDAVIEMSRGENACTGVGDFQVEACYCWWCVLVFRAAYMLLIGFAHKSTRDIIWQNYLIPKGTTIIGNVWCV